MNITPVLISAQPSSRQCSSTRSKSWLTKYSPLEATTTKQPEEFLIKCYPRDVSVFDKLSGIVVTGIGAESAPFQARQFSDISCQAAGCRSLFPSARIVIDIGGQFTRAVKLTPQGRVANFLMSEKCATGSGRFLQVIARILRIKIEDIGPLSLKSQRPVEFSTNCAVFAESETISRIAEGARMEDILAGVHRALAAKAAMLVKRLKMEQDVVLTGGGGEDAGLVSAVSEALGVNVLVPEQPRLTAALGAATLAKEEKPGTR